MQFTSSCRWLCFMATVSVKKNKVARLVEIFELIYFKLYSDLRTRWSQMLYFPEEIVSKDHLLIWVDRNIFKNRS